MILQSNADIKEFYEKFPYPSTVHYALEGVILPNLKSFFEVADPNLRILCGGCGTCEPVLVYQGNTKCREIVGVDLSQRSLDICQEFVNKVPNAPIRLVCDDLVTYKDEEKFDVVTLTGVMHHIRDVDALLKNLHSLLGANGILVGFLYAKMGREHIINKHAEFTGFPKNIEGVKLVKDHLSSLTSDDPCRKWFEFYNKEDEEIADTWLHPYFVHYDVDSLTELLNRHSFGLTNYQENNGKILFSAKINTSVPQEVSISDTNNENGI